ncbi:hypothetical protein [Dyella silvatica]|uniref:hypothetical protein n=1 Tax=Dyella silvatica TaxID=2992128 RepID=UPI00225499CE|nr:hypothetical protein [Dyella silvatica]
MMVKVGETVSDPEMLQLPGFNAVLKANLLLLKEPGTGPAPQVIPSGAVTFTLLMVTVVSDVGVAGHGRPAALICAHRKLLPLNVACVTEPAPTAFVAITKSALQATEIPPALRLVWPTALNVVFAGLNLSAKAGVTASELTASMEPSTRALITYMSTTSIKIRCTKHRLAATPDRALQQQTSGSAATRQSTPSKVLKNAPALGRCEFIRGSIQVEKK